ncbi:MAG TPA: NAD(P)/FAD-dependent oxidoreductase [Candidatus Binatia bacterium]|nr:NAD(P)/FAD-dependent oxidoreductase [Candidatus Binatia bacterium]
MNVLSALRTTAQAEPAADAQTIDAAAPAADELVRPHRVVIVGGGFAGLNVARVLAGTDLDVTIVDKRNFHLFQPLLYQVATGALSPGDIAAPLREILRKSSNVRTLLAEVTDIDLEARQVLFGQQGLSYDSLIVAIGMVNNYFGHDEWERLAPGLKSIEDATEIRSRMLLAFELAERNSDPKERQALLTFVVVGGGATGVEMAGAIAEIAADTLRSEFRSIARESVRVVLVEGAGRVLTAFPEALSASAEQTLARMGVELRMHAMVRDIDAEGVTVELAGTQDRIPARVVVWAAGVRGHPLAASLAEQTGATLSRQGTVPVREDLTLPNHPEVFVVGDLAYREQDGRPLPGVAQVAIQQGRYAAETILARQTDKTPPPFRYEDKGSMATIGRAKAVAAIGRLELSGFVAWLAWLFVHLLFLVGFENRVLVLLQWSWYYFWRRRSARLITAWSGDSRAPSRF